MADLVYGEKNGLRFKVNLGNGQLISLKKDDVEFFHNGGDPRVAPKGWGNSEIVTFPIFGKASGPAPHVKGTLYSLGQHGISRHTKYIPFKLKENSAGLVSLVQNYDGNNTLPNTKYFQNSGEPKYVKWLSYSLEKTFMIENDDVSCILTVTNMSDREMPYVIGWHPAFNSLGKMQRGIFLDDGGKQVAILDQVASSTDPAKGAYLVPGATSLTYVNMDSGNGIKVSADFGESTLLWTPGMETGMFCIENSTKFPEQGKMNYFDEKLNFEKLQSGQVSRQYVVKLSPHA